MIKIYYKYFLCNLHPHTSQIDSKLRPNLRRHSAKSKEPAMNWHNRILYILLADGLMIIYIWKVRLWLFHCKTQLFLANWLSECQEHSGNVRNVWVINFARLFFCSIHSLGGLTGKYRKKTRKESAPSPFYFFDSQFGCLL